MKENQSGIYIIIIAFVAILFGIIAVQVISDQTQAVSTKAYVTDTINIASARNESGQTNQTFVNFYGSLTQRTNNWRAENSECAIADANLVLKNSSGYTAVSTTDYTYTADTSLTLLPTITWNTGKGASNSTTATYSYCPTGYIASSWGRTVLNLTPGFYILGILAVGVGFALWFLRKEGVM